MYQQEEDILFRDWHWDECLEHLDNTIQHSDNIILVSGAVGSGKTTLKQELINLFSDYLKIFSIYGDPRIGVTTLIRQITIGFGLPWDNNLAPDWGELQKAIFSQPNCRWLLIVDDAEKLSWDVFNSLIRLYTIVNLEGSPFSLILLADISLEDNLKKSVLKDFCEHKFQIVNIKPLTFDQMTNYLHSLNFTFDHKTLKKIYKASNGVIGMVKQLANSELNLQQSTGENMLVKNVLQNIISPPGIRVTVCCSLLIVAYVLFGVIQKKDSLPKLALDLIESAKPVISQSSLQTGEAADSSTNMLSKNVALDSYESGKSTELVNVVEISRERVTNQTEASQAQLHQVQNVTAAQYEELYQRLYTDLKNSLERDLQAEINKLNANQLEHINEKLDQKIAALKQLKVGNKDAKTVTKTEPDNVAVKNLLGVAKNRYTLQLMASKNEQTVKKLINANPLLNGRAKYFQGKFTPQQEDPWFVVVYGSYASKELALNDLKTLPAGLRGLKPIARTYGSIHQLINNNAAKK